MTAANLADWGWGLWLLVAVMGFNLAMIPLWFILGALKRNHELQLKRAKAILSVLEGEAEGDGALAADLAFVQEQVGKAEGLGPLWGRKHVQSARIWLDRIEAAHPEVQR